MEGYTKVFRSVSFSECVSMYHVGRLHWRFLSGDSQQLAFLRMKTHHPLLFPFLKGIKVHLEFVCICLRSYLFIDEANRTGRNKLKHVLEHKEKLMGKGGQEEYDTITEDNITIKDPINNQKSHSRLF